jgi:hypothetical protein
MTYVYQILNDLIRSANGSDITSQKTAIAILSKKLDRLEHKLMEIREDTLFDRIFRDSEGQIVIAQPPNLPLIVWIVASLLTFVVTTGKINLGLDLVAFGSLFTWAWEELFQGVNYFRRALGLIALVALIASKIL